MTVLRNGRDVPGPVVRVTVLSMERLLENNPVAFVEAVEVARDPSHRPWGQTGKVLAGAGLTGAGGRMHGAMRDVILACTEGDGAGLRLVSPYPPGGAA